jgi:hypothetical protein
MQEYHVTVRYRTNSGCNAKSLKVSAPDSTAAIKLASDQVRKMRGVIGIDDVECNTLTPAAG